MKYDSGTQRPTRRNATSRLIPASHGNYIQRRVEVKGRADCTQFFFSFLFLKHLSSCCWGGWRRCATLNEKSCRSDSSLSSSPLLCITCEKKKNKKGPGCLLAFFWHTGWPAYCAAAPSVCIMHARRLGYIYYYFCCLGWARHDFLSTR